MNVLIKLCILGIISLLFSGCMAAMINHASMPKETKDIKNYNIDKISDKTKTDLFIYKSVASLTDKSYVYVNNNIIEPISSGYYLYFEAQPGVHWIYEQDQHNLGINYACKNIRKNTKEIVDLSFPLNKPIAKDMDIKRTVMNEESVLPRSQVKQKIKKIEMDFSYKSYVNSAKIEILPKDNPFLFLLKKVVKESFDKLSINEGNGLKIVMSIPNDNHSFPKKIHYNTSNIGYNIAYLKSIKLEFFIDDKKIDEHISRGYYNTSFLGLGTKLSSYIACKYFSKQFPTYKK